MKIYPLIQGGIIVGGAYLLPKVLNYLTSPPTAEQEASSLGQVRTNLARAKESLHEQLGEKVWFYATRVIGENGWVAALSLYSFQHLSRKDVALLQPTSIEEGMSPRANLSLFIVPLSENFSLIEGASGERSTSSIQRIAHQLEKVEKNVLHAGLFSSIASVSFFFRFLSVLVCPKLKNYL